MHLISVFDKMSIINNNVPQKAEIVDYIRRVEGNGSPLSD